MRAAPAWLTLANYECVPFDPCSEARYDTRHYVDNPR